MPAKIRHRRGDVYLANQEGLVDGQIFWSYHNTDPIESRGHTRSEGQLWAKDPSSDKLLEIADRRKLNADSFRGFIDRRFEGDFVNADEKLFADYRFCKAGDYWIFDVDRPTGFDYKFVKGDILYIDSVEYEDVESDTFRQKLKSVKYIRIPGTTMNSETTDLEAEDVVSAVQELEFRLKYSGYITRENIRLSDLTAKKGWMYLVADVVHYNSDQFELTGKETLSGSQVVLVHGDFIFWNGNKWQVIPAGLALYQVNAEAIDAVTTFTDSHKEQLKSATDYESAIHILNVTKAQLDENGKIPLSQLPNSVRDGLVLQGKFYPLKDTYDNASDPNDQNSWPIYINPDTQKPDDYRNGAFWIVDCNGVKNVPYLDKTIDGRVIELNTNDFIVWTAATGRFEVIDNSDRVTGLTIAISDGTNRKVTLAGNIQVQANGRLRLFTKDDDTLIIDSTRLLGQDTNRLGKKDYLAQYLDENTLTPSDLHKVDERIVDDIGFQVGNIANTQMAQVYGNMGVSKTIGSTKTTYINNYMFIESATTTKDGNDVFFRETDIHASNRNNFATGEDERIDIFYPEASSTLLGVYLEDSLTPDYHSKVAFDGFITDTLTSEWVGHDPVLAENYENGQENVGIGRTVTEDTDTGEITFFGKSKDRYNTDYRPQSMGFFTTLHSVANGISKGANLYEHFLNRHVKPKTHLVINPNILIDEVETFVRMPLVSGTLLTWEELAQIFGEPGVPLMIPAWELKAFRDRDFVGLDTSPVTIKINRKATGHTKVDRTNDLSKDYGKGVKSTWSYIGSSKEGSLQDETRTSIDDVVSFDSWLEAQRAVASNEAFVLPASAIKDGESVVDTETGEYTEDPTETKMKAYDRNSKGGYYQRILPSRSIYKDETVYYDPFTGKLIPQQTYKDIELPAEGGVLLTSRSRIDGGIWIS